ncbi:peptide-binding protein [Seleniivibrio woodruffii]|uniref:Peptide/nickel transport system substrate-binding protein n=1 Tax=Seleniivibrio woodruffii TaxID=1078050 RepID=A0A4V6NEH0_9BACT|nr:peptide-binding protein [Seleniivibrio woodruffii]TCK61791.1 peptide/nickel transport system substrate-binding protein [Seleniivibrio woodruffii]TVZ35094.1 peptide/nickel transport system substrate-binding protein [Seleniivibrio woodruffii]
MIKKILVLLLAAAVFGCGQKKSGESGEPEVSRKRNVPNAVYGDAMVESLLGDATGLIYNITSDSASHDVAGKIYNGLVKYDQNLTITGDLADWWEVLDDGKTIIFHLNQDVRWHDGKPFTAEDVEFTYKFMIDDKTPTSYDADFRLVSKLEVIDKYTVKVSYDEPYAPALISWGMPMLPKHLLQGQDVKKSPLLRRPVGTGPYKFLEWKAGDSITLVANDDYFLGRPYLDRYIFRIIPDTATTFLELLNGAVDIMSLTPLQWSKQTDSNPRFKQQYDKHKYLASSYEYVGYNLRKPMFQDKRVRQALSYATPKQDIIKGIRFGMGVEATGPFKPGTIWYNPDVKKYDYNIEQAKKLLAEAGYKDTNGDGIVEKDGKPLKFELITNQGNSVRTSTAEVLQKSWEKVGVKVEIRVLEWATFINEYINKQKFDAVMLGWNITNDPDLYDVWHSANCGGQKLNFICYKNAEFDKLLIEGRKEFDTEKRKEYYFKAQEILAEEQPYTFLYVPDALVAVNKRFHEVQPAPAGIGYNQEDWWVDKDKQKYSFQK